MRIEIRARDAGGGTAFCPTPRRLHLGGERAAGVDRLEFDLPEEWQALSVSLYIEHEDGTLMAPILLDSDGGAAVGRVITQAKSGRWMLGATNGVDYAAYSVPGSYDVYETIDTSGDGEEVPQSQYEAFVAEVLAAANTAHSAAENAQESQGAAQQAARSAAADADAAADAAQRAEAAAPIEGAVVSVNGKGGIVRLDAADVEAVPVPGAAQPGALLVIESAGEDGAITTTAVGVDGGYGVRIDDGALMIAPATAAQLAAMSEGYTPLTPALVPLAVKLALTKEWKSAGWTDADREAVRSLLGAGTGSGTAGGGTLTAAVQAAYNMSAEG